MSQSQINSQSPSEQLYWGEYSDLYSTLLPHQVAHLERAIHAKRIGRFQDAYDIFDNLLPPAHELPVLALERSSLYQRQGLDSASSKLLKETIGCHTMWEDQVQGNELVLLNILLAEVESRGYGKLREAVAQARITRDLLKDVNVDSYTDIEVGCVRSYYSILERCQHQSNWLDRTTDPFFPSTLVRIPWQGIEAVRQERLRRNKLYISHSLLRLEEDFTDQNIYFARVEDFIQICEASEHAAAEQIMLLVILAKLYYSELLINAGRLEFAEVLLNWVSDKIRTGFLIQGESSKGVHYARFHKQLRFLHSPPVASQKRVEQLMEVTTEAENDQDLLMEISTFSKIFGIFNHIPRAEWTPTLSDLHDRCQKRYLHITSLGNVGALFANTAITRLALVAAAHEVEGFLGAVADFEAKYPEYFLPILGESMYRSAARIAWQHGDSDQARRYEEKLRVSIINSPYGEASVDGSWRFTKAARSNPSHFIREYRLGHSSQWARPLLSFVIDWIKTELEEELISAEEASQLLCVNDLVANGHERFNDSSKLKIFLDTLDPGKAAKNLFGSPKPVSVEVWAERLARLERWLKLTDRPPAAEVRQTILGDLQNARVGFVQLYHQAQIDLDLERNSETGNFDHKMQLDVRIQHKREADRHVALLKSLHTKAMDATGDGLFTAEWVATSQLVNLSTSNEAFKQGIISDSELCRGQCWMEETLERQRRTEAIPSSLMNTMISISLFRWQRYVLFGSQNPQDCLEILRQLEEVYVNLRRQQSVLKGWRLFNSRTTFMEGTTTILHRQFAIRTILEICGVVNLRDSYHRMINQSFGVGSQTRMVSLKGEHQHLFVELVNWTQKLKAQSALESLGSDIILPANILSRLEPESKGAQLLLRESQLQHKVSITLAEQVETRRKLDELRVAMRIEPSLELIMSIREGASLGAAQIRTLSQELGSDVVLVDWVFLPTGFTGSISELLPMIYRGGQLVRAVFAERITYNYVRAWVENYMDEKQHPCMFSECGDYGSETPEEILHLLDALVAPLELCSKPGEIVVLSPTNLLHRVPLHALHVQGQPLIERNPVVYTQSLSMLRMCQVLADARDTSQDFKAVITEALPSSDLVRPSMKFADDIGTLVFKDELLSKEVFLEVASDADLLHFHGHVLFEENAPLDHFMQIKGEETITARDVFDLKLNSGSHVTLIGCSSGRARISAQDDLLGLSMAFHYAGASSITSTLWDIQKSDGADFEEAFYGALRNQQFSSPDNKLLNLATAMQSAIIELRKDKNGPPGSVRAPYHWAGFVIHGYWKFPCLPVSTIETSPGRYHGLRDWCSSVGQFGILSFLMKLIATGMEFCKNRFHRGLCWLSHLWAPHGRKQGVADE